MEKYICRDVIMNKYKFKPLAGWDDTVSWVTIVLMIIYFTAAGVWAFYG